MKILFGISSFEVGGTELHALKAMRVLRAAGHDVAVIVARPTGDLSPEFVNQFPVFTYDIRSLLSWSYLTATMQVRSVLKSWDPDVVHALDKYSNAVLLPVARVSGIKRVIGSKRWYKYLPSQYRYINALTFKFAHAVTANSEAIRKTLVRSDWVSANKSDVIWNILDDAMFQRPDEDWLTARRTEFGIPEATSVIGMVARLSEVKDHETFFRAFTRVLQANSAAIAVCVGDGPQRERLRNVALELGIADQVRLVGYRTNLPNINWLFDVAVLTSTSEGSPNSILEAMAAGCPIVASNVGGLRDIPSFGPPTVLATPGDDVGFANGMLEFLGNAPESLAVRLERSRSIQQRFSTDQFLRTSERIYGL